MTNIPQHELYPSTHDILPPIAGAAQDFEEVLDTMEVAYDRLLHGWSATTYLESYEDVNEDNEKVEVVHVCSIGAVLWAAGVRAEPGNIKDFIEVELASTAKEAIRLLDEAAVELYPWSTQWFGDSWTGPLETVNQTRTSTLEDYEVFIEPEDFSDLEAYDRNADPRKLRALRVYEHAIQKRKDALAPA